ncbi:hypothetical protein Dsin_006183 [Dipteronia sinensis]|uniref:C2H2-type domain-containing protein n=1 Tax=Dipteronia sinensis TaxID=43782 RepID=A0AAE0AY11_9ROSI|nr:hypothetical protein Dsin_006183 [Dipteronia sinensis]
MKANPPGIEKSNLILRTTSTSDEHDQNSSSDRGGHVNKSYTCAFCKRGFSNAQALGGHMNIHRRDRAKLRQFAVENLLSLDITKTNNLIIDDEPPDVDHASEEKMNENTITEYSSEVKSCTTPNKRSCTSLSEDGIEELQQLPFFAETPSASGDHIKKAASSRSCSKENEEKRIQLRHSDHSSQVELDLELRLGPEPGHDHDQTSTAITKDFF